MHSNARFLCDIFCCMRTMTSKLKVECSITNAYCADDERVICKKKPMLSVYLAV